MSLLELHQVSKRLGKTSASGRNFQLLIPTFSLERASELVIVGASGSGKTTLLNLIAGIITPDEGVIRLNGTDISQLSEAKRDRFRAMHIGYVHQTFNLLQGLTALENVLAAAMFTGGSKLARDSKERAMMLLTRLGLEKNIHQRPRELSVGEQQRVAVARALVNAPALILADEPTASVDADNAREVIETMKSLASSDGASILTITHDRAVHEMFAHSIAISDIVQQA